MQQPLGSGCDHQFLEINVHWKTDIAPNLILSLLTATILGAVYTLVSYLSFKTINICEFFPAKLIPIRVQWMRTVSSLIADVMFDIWFFISTS